MNLAQGTSQPPVHGQRSRQDFANVPLRCLSFTQVHSDSSVRETRHRCLCLLTSSAPPWKRQAFHVQSFCPTTQRQHPEFFPILWSTLPRQGRLPPLSPRVLRTHREAPAVATKAFTREAPKHRPGGFLFPDPVTFLGQGARPS